MIPPAEEARYAAMRAELDAIEERLQPVLDWTDARGLMFAIVETTLLFYGSHDAGDEMTTSLWRVAIVFHEARTALSNGGAWLASWHTSKADRLAAEYFRPRGWGAPFPMSRSVPYELAGLVRRACSLDVRRMLPLVVRDACELLREAGGDEGIVEAIVVDALKAVMATLTEER